MNAQLAPAPLAGLSTFAPGIYPDVPHEVYHRRELGVVNNGALKILSGKTPAHYYARSGMKATCHNCTCLFDISTGHYNRAKKLGLNVYCGRACAGIAHRKDISERQRKADKAAYDKARRERERDRINAQKRERYHATKEDRADILRAHRKKRASKHAEYCRRYEYRQYKKEYDRKHLAKKNYGEFAEAALICREVEEILDQQATKYERMLVNGTINKAQSRRRAL